jgi:hypothetical protein
VIEEVESAVPLLAEHDVVADPVLRVRQAHQRPLRLRVFGIVDAAVHSFSAPMPGDVEATLIALEPVVVGNALPRGRSQLL